MDLLQSLVDQITVLSNLGNFLVFVAILVVAGIGVHALIRFIRRREEEIAIEASEPKRGGREKKVEEKESQKSIILPTLVPKKVRVIIMYPDREIECFGKLSPDGSQIKTKFGTFIVPADYKPKITWCHRKTYLTFYFSYNGTALVVDHSGKVKDTAPEPGFMRVLVDKGLIAKIFRMGMDLSSLLTGVFLGAFVVVMIIFVMLPMMGIPVLIGRQPIEIITQTQPATPVLPPAGNFTIPP